MGAIKILVGWFDRYPPEYYETRLTRVLGELQEKPDNLSLYDDAAVALDRLHRSSEAIATMARKDAKMNELRENETENDLSEHQYRYLANLGTFHVHDWIGREKAIRNADLSSLKKGEELIEAAIALNPDAHFGREKHQLMAIQWLQKKEDYPDAGVLTGPMGESVRSLSVESNQEAQEGFLGMIKLGAAWESIDFFNTLAELYSAERSGSLSHLAGLRMEELRKQGRTSLHPHADALYYRIYGSPETNLRNDLEEWYHSTRRKADERQESRWAYLRNRLADGRHPDTDPDFWNDWKEPEFPTLPGARFKDYFSFAHHPLFYVGLLISLFILLWLISLKRRRRLARLETAGPGHSTVS